jgi:hypothetical protein
MAALRSNIDVAVGLNLLECEKALSTISRNSYGKCSYRPSCYEWASVSRSRARPPRVVPQLCHKV